MSRAHTHTHTYARRTQRELSRSHTRVDVRLAYVCVHASRAQVDAHARGRSVGKEDGGDAKGEAVASSKRDAVAGGGGGRGECREGHRE